MEDKGKAIAELNDGKWTCEFVFVVDVTTHFNELNTLLPKQRPFNQFHYQFLQGFRYKIMPWNLSRDKKKKVHFPTVLNWYFLGLHAEE